MTVERALTVRQPWADLIVQGIKDVENRTWPVPSTLPQWRRCRGCGEYYHPENGWPGVPGDGCAAYSVGDGHFGPHDVDPPFVGPFPFRIAIHAAKQRDKEQDRRIRRMAAQPVGMRSPWLADYDRTASATGAFIGTVEVTGCHSVEDCVDTGPEFECATHSLPYGCEPGCGQGMPCSPGWADPDPGMHHWWLSDARLFDVPIPATGRLGLWKLDGAQQAAIAAM